MERGIKVNYDYTAPRDLLYFPEFLSSRFKNLLLHFRPAGRDSLSHKK